MTIYISVEKAKRYVKALEDERDEINNHLSTKQAATTNQAEVDRLQRERDLNWQRHEAAIENAKKEVAIAEDYQKQQEQAKSAAASFRLEAIKNRAKTNILLHGVSEKEFDEVWWPKIFEKQILGEVESEINLIPENSVHL